MNSSNYEYEIGIDLNRFPSDVFQINSIMCIPACAEAIFRYHDSSFNYTQSDIRDWIIRLKGSFDPSFSSLSNCIPPSVADNFILMNPNYPDSFDDWLESIISELSNNRPVGISTRIPGDGAHIRVVLGNSEQNGLLIFDPAWRINPAVEVLSFTSIEDADTAWNLPDPCRDQLLIHPIQ